MSRMLSGIKGIRRVIGLPGIKKDMEISKRWSLPEFEKIIEPVELFDRNLISADRKTTVISLILDDVERKEAIIDSVKQVIGEKRETKYCEKQVDLFNTIAGKVTLCVAMVDNGLLLC